MAMLADTLASGQDSLAVWRELERLAVLRCPACSAPLRVGRERFLCTGCAGSFPVEDGVPLLLRPEDVTAVPERVMTFFNIGPADRARVESALATLTRYRAYRYPEFANFFARFDTREWNAAAVPLGAMDSAEAVAKVECVTSSFPGTLRTDPAEYRSVRIRNNSSRVLFTDERSPLFLSYRLFTAEGEPIPFEGHRSPLPCPLRPGEELTIPVLVRLPPGLTGPLIVRFHFVRVDPGVPDIPPPPPEVGIKGAIALFRHAVRRRLSGVPPAPPAPAPAPAPAPPPDVVSWFDGKPLAEMRVTATHQGTNFPAASRGSLSEFDVAEDVARADRYLAGIIGAVRASGVPNPRILEIGAGVHPIALRACDEASTVIVSDISLVMQQLASIMHAHHPAVAGGRAGFASLDLLVPPFAEGSLDVICICAALHHIPAPREFLAQAARLLSPKGRFVALREPCSVNPFEPTYITELTNGFNEQMFEMSEWQHFVEGAGLVIDDAVIDFGSSLKFSARRAS